MKKVLITGANGFIARNLITHLSVRNDIEVLSFTHDDSMTLLPELMKGVDFIFHLAGVNRPQTEEEFQEGNTDLTRSLCKAIESSGRPIPILFTSSIQSNLDNAYGVSKQAAENILLDMSVKHNSKVYIFKLPNVFGKWAHPNYNSVVATFCHNISHNLPIQINDPNTNIPLVYIDDVITHFLDLLDGKETNDSFITVEPQYNISLGDLADQLYKFKDSRNTLVTEEVGTGLTRALYSTYLSYLSPENFTYEVPKYEDARGVFVEMLKMHDSGQFSYFTILPGITRGGHYHHSKTEKFLVVKGKAYFRFRHVISGKYFELYTNAETPEVVETVPGWSHDITNVSDEDVIVLIWASEIFNNESPDTYDKPLETE